MKSDYLIKLGCRKKKRQKKLYSMNDNATTQIQIEALKGEGKGREKGLNLAEGLMLAVL